MLYWLANRCIFYLVIIYCFQVTAFGGEKVLRLLKSIDRHHDKFKSPPIGPIGAHVVRGVHQLILCSFQA